jgi:glycosyltransferase involved in cell wall biosynthesis
MRCVTGPSVNAVVHRCIKGSVAASAVATLEASVARFRGLYDKVDRFVAPSLFLRDVMVAGGFASDRIDVVPNPIQVVERDPHAMRQRRFVYVGRLAAEKGLSTLFDAIALVRTPGIEFDVYGDGPLGDELRRRVEIERLPVALHGRVGPGEVSSALTRARALVLPSVWYENCPMSILEASAAGVPTIASRIGGVPELVEDGVSGLLVAADDARALAEAIEMLANDDRRAAELGGGALERVRTRHSPERYRSRILATYGDAGALRTGSVTTAAVG